MKNKVKFIKFLIKSSFFVFLIFWLFVECAINIHTIQEISKFFLNLIIDFFCCGFLFFFLLFLCSFFLLLLYLLITFFIRIIFSILLVFFIRYLFHFFVKCLFQQFSLLFNFKLVSKFDLRKIFRELNMCKFW